MATNVGAQKRRADKRKEAEEVVPVSQKYSPMLTWIAASIGWDSLWPRSVEWNRVMRSALIATTLWVFTFLGWSGVLGMWNDAMERGGEMHLMGPAFCGIFLYAPTAVTLGALIVWVARFAGLSKKEDVARKWDQDLVRAADAFASRRKSPGEAGCGVKGVGSSQVSAEELSTHIGRPERSSWRGAWGAAACALILMVALLVVSIARYQAALAINARSPGWEPGPPALSWYVALLLTLLPVSLIVTWGVLYRQKQREQELEEERTWRLAEAAAGHPGFLDFYDEWYPTRPH